MKKIIITACLILAYMVSAAQDAAATLHLIVAAATNDPDLGESVSNDLKHTTDEFREIAKCLDAEYNEVLITGEDLCRSKLEKAIQDLEAGANDIVAFVYCGHGFRFKDDTDEYPRMLLKHNKKMLLEGDYMSMTEAYNMLEAKNARLTLVFSDCCNSDIGIPRTEVEDDNAFMRRGNNQKRDLDKLRSLFLDQSGSVRATAAMPGQKAYCTADGGYLITGLLNNIRASTSMNKDNEPSWNQIITNTNSYVMKKARLATDGETDSEAPQVMVRSIKLSNEPEANGIAVMSHPIKSTDSADGNPAMARTWIAIASGIAAIIAIMLIRRKNK